LLARLIAGKNTGYAYRENVIHHPAPEVFAYISDPPRLPHWISNLLEVKMGFPVVGLGATYCDVTKFWGRLLTQECQIIEYEPP
jgi:uncharacterized protein YndB with AHSA1/START domain